MHLIVLYDTHTHTHILGRTTLDDGSVQRRHLYLYNIHKRQKAILASETTTQSQQARCLRPTP
jgi:hypothetical protein